MITHHSWSVTVVIMSKLPLILAFLLVDFTANAAKYLSCPRGWLTYRGSRSCYRLGGTSNSFTKARRACFAMGGDLVKINSAQENKYVALLARTIPRNIGSVWIGLVRDRNNKFTWIDGTSLSRQYSNWRSGEPNNHQRTENCVELISVGVNMKWNDVQCKRPDRIVMAYICEKEKPKCCS